MLSTNTSKQIPIQLFEQNGLHICQYGSHFILYVLSQGPEMTDLSWCSSLDTILVLLHQVLIKNTVITEVVGSVGTSLLHQEH